MRKVYNFAAKYVRKSSICFEFVFTYIVVIEECSSSSTFRLYCFCQSGKKKFSVAAEKVVPNANYSLA